MYIGKSIHVALIPDGNRRWAKNNNRPEWYGHMMGARKMEKFTDWILKHPEIKTVSIYALSTENLKRDETELKKLWDIYNAEFRKLTNSKKIKENGVKINIIGEQNTWRPDVKHVAKELMKATKNYTKSVLNVLLAYGGQAEILTMVKEFAKKESNKCEPIKERASRYLMVNSPVDLVIRTGGQFRLSNFLLFQTAYAELYFTKTLWPDFNEKEFEKSIRWYYTQKRKFGK
jgi:undecaprenyl diphosphate synthase